MSDMKIEVDSSAVSTAKAALGEYANDWAKMVTSIINEEKRLERAMDASSDAINRALDKVVGAAAQRQVQASKTYWQAFEQQIGITGNRATEVGATFTKLGQIIQNQAKQSSAYWDDFGKKVGTHGSRATENGAGYGALAEQMQKEAAELEKLRAKYDSNYAAVLKYNGMKRELNTLMQSGRGDVAQYAAELDRLTQEFVQFQNGVAQAGNRFASFDNALVLGNKSANRFQAGVQNAGYQVADFAVQIQGGTSWLVALGQQGSQLIAMVPGWGAVAGAVLAIGSAAAYAFTKTKESSDELVDSLDGLAALEDIFEGAGVKLEDSIGGAIDRVRAKYGEFVADLVESDVEREAQGIVKAFQSIEGATAPSWMDRFIANAVAGGGQGAPGISTFSEDLDAKEATAGRVSSVLEAFGEGKSPEDMVQIYEEVLNVLEATSGVNEEIIKQVQDQAIELGINVAAREEALAAEEKMLEIGERASEALDARNEARNDAREYANETKLSMQEELDLLQTANRYGEESVEYLKKQHEYAMLKLGAEAVSEGLNWSQTQALKEQLSAQQALEVAVYNQLKAWENVDGVVETVFHTIESISGIDLEGPVWGAVSAADAFYYRMLDVLGTINGILGAIGQIGFDTVALQAENAALAAGSNAAEANVAGQNAVFETRMDQSFGTSGIGGILGNLASRAHEIAQEERLGAQNENDGLMQTLRDREREERKKARGGGRTKKDPKTAEDYLDEYEFEIEQRERLIGLSEEQREIEEYRAEIEQKLGETFDENSKSQAERIEALAQEKDRIEEAIKAQLEAEAATKRMTDALEGNFKSAMMSIVEGTESVGDAFKKMLRGMILDIYEQMVLDKYTKYASGFLGNMLGGAGGGGGGFLSGLFSANGNAFGPSGHISYFAKGDVFDSPTAFQFGGGKTGVMGEAGPEAVMPLKRGADGKLGVVAQSGNGSVVIQQHFHISANGDESVRKIVRSEAPRIAQQAKAAVAEANSRGGSFRKAMNK